MSDTTIIKIDSAHSPKVSMGQTYLAMSKTMAMRLWVEDPSDLKPPVQRDYETIGYVMSGRAELHSEGQLVTLNAGDSWVVPKGAHHSYRILEKFTAVEVTHPPAPVHSRDE
jgi:quercetin dioxygenase-like cupin family protein